MGFAPSWARCRVHRRRSTSATRAAVERAVAEPAAASRGAIDLLVNNAGLALGLRARAAGVAGRLGADGRHQRSRRLIDSDARPVLPADGGARSRARDQPRVALPPRAGRMPRATSTAVDEGRSSDAVLANLRAEPRRRGSAGSRARTPVDLVADTGISIARGASASTGSGWRTTPTRSPRGAGRPGSREPDARRAGRAPQRRAHGARRLLQQMRDADPTVRACGRLRR